MSFPSPTRNRRTRNARRMKRSASCASFGRRGPFGLLNPALGGGVLSSSRCGIEEPLDLPPPACHVYRCVYPRPCSPLVPLARPSLLCATGTMPDHVTLSSRKTKVRLDSSGVRTPAAHWALIVCTGNRCGAAAPVNSTLAPRIVAMLLRQRGACGLLPLASGIPGSMWVSVDGELGIVGE
ncbi:hypothetical protein FB45DRAFT_279222 [Roridomyces roridus]|uniref:Uncharacterized protein n=1 Tax=Roridomyces roridus TaxID=1738132 RepID=A0AAD7CA27_9AGAR|nr:hypothetical protein FB45DRAFT_279222 [Roridomyces roridus]